MQTFDDQCQDALDVCEMLVARLNVIESLIHHDDVHTVLLDINTRLGTFEDLHAANVFMLVCNTIIMMFIVAISLHLTEQ